VEVADNGVGIAPENMPRMFPQGFTTKKTGHGFGLHISALAATEMKGRLTCASSGAGQGATFTLELPMAGQEDPA
jgi:two-component system, LuxR family, sensor kinase FixL